MLQWSAFSRGPSPLPAEKWRSSACRPSMTSDRSARGSRGGSKSSASIEYLFALKHLARLMPTVAPCKFFGDHPGHAGAGEAAQLRDRIADFAHSTPAVT